MKVKSVHVGGRLRRFKSLKIEDIPETAKLVVLVGPNGSGKSTVFEAFNRWCQRYQAVRMREHTMSHLLSPSFWEERGLAESDDHQQGKRTEVAMEYLQNLLIEINFHDMSRKDHYKVQDSKNFEIMNRDCFDIRTSHRSTRSGGDGFSDMGSTDVRLPQNRDRIKNLVQGAAEENRKRGLDDIIDAALMKIRVPVKNLFGNLIVHDLKNPLGAATLIYKKGAATLESENLSGGELAALDILLDFVVQVEGECNKVFCIDEPEVHIHTKLQANLLQEMLRLLPDNCQLWIATHSVGMIHKAVERHRQYPGTVTFLDFTGKNFDEDVTLKPAKPTRGLWQESLEVALDDMAGLVMPRQLILCEGSTDGADGRKNFDARAYNKIFSERYPEVQFVSIGSRSEVQGTFPMIEKILKEVVPGVESLSVIDLDDQIKEVAKDNQESGAKVLERRAIENYLWAEEILKKLEKEHNGEDRSLLVNERQRLLNKSGMPNDIKSITQDLHQYCRNNLEGFKQRVKQSGINKEDFALAYLAPLITEETDTYRELEKIIFGSTNPN